MEVDIGMEIEMEMDITKLEIDALPKLEKELIAHMKQIFPAGYIFSFSAEESTNLIARSNLHELSQYSNIALLRSGSAGRLDGAGVGDQDFILLTSNITEDFDKDDLLMDEKSIDELISRIKKITDWGMQVNSVCTVEHKSLDKNKDTLIYHSSNNKPFPGRILEAVFIAGNKALVKKAKLDTLKQLYGNNRVLKRIKEELKTYKKNTISGETIFKKDKYPQFVAHLKSVLYNPENKIHGFKYGPLRYMQLALAIEFYNLLVNKKVEPEFLIDLPASLEDRFRYIFRKGLCSKKHEQYLITFALSYIKTVNIQSKLKLDYYSENNIPREMIVFQLTEKTIPTLQELVEKHPLGEIIDTSIFTKTI
jgi:hypothetical protein